MFLSFCMKRFSQSRGTLGRNKTAPGKGVERKLVMNTPTRVTRMILIWFFIGSVILTACGGGGSTATAGASPAATKGSVLKGRILFGRYNQAVDGFQIFTINPDGTHEVQLLPGAADCPSFAPGGSKILVCVTNPKGLGRPATLNPDGSGFTLLDTSDPSLNLPCGAWSSRGKLACEGWDDVHPTRTPGIFTVRSSDGGGLVRVTANPYGGHDIPGSYSPDGTRIVFGRENANLHQFALFVANANGSDLRQISGWQPDFAGAS